STSLPSVLIPRRSVASGSCSPRRDTLRMISPPVFSENCKSRTTCESSSCPTICAFASMVVSRRDSRKSGSHLALYSYKGVAVEPIVGIFSTRAAAQEAAHLLGGHGFAGDDVSMLLPGEAPQEVEAEVPTEEAEQSGVGQAIGGVVGGAAGASA